MKLPLGTRLRLKLERHAGPLRPKQFIVLQLESDVLHLTLERYARSWPILLRYRLWKKARKLVAAHEKLVKFIDNQGVRID